ncbi:sugar phosphate isomerase/epimerase [Ruminococcus sp. OA3]|uniref:sugar phosphate isomerase/epimerase family protein n=1 Tax=Ruminococcus sp. OA3 TaxID=2914164 RepID=UPI001F055F11|nr:sugar phosphate isomerase/epimerase family protein [Ruminococcus sp. OA3]MCH1981459.1 sugar phosphate isomerase/epimerase [Ruminococcus sp. OA3]
MNKIGLHIGYWWGTGEEHDIFNMLELTHHAGLDVIEINPDWLMRMTESECREFTEKLDAYHMSATLNGGLTAENDIASDSASARSAGIEFCKRVLDKMPKLGLTVWSGCNYSEWLRCPDASQDAQEEKKRALGYCRDSMREIIKTAEAVGVDYCFEVLNRFEQFLFNTSSEAVAFAESVGSDRAKILLDSYHMNIEEDVSSAAIAYACAKRRLGHFHVGSSNRRIPGLVADDINWNNLARALNSSGYEGAIVMEPFVLTSAHNAKRTRVWRSLSSEADPSRLVADAFAGGQFLRKVLADNQ